MGPCVLTVPNQQSKTLTTGEGKIEREKAMINIEKQCISELTCDSHSITEVDGIPDHRPVRDRYEGLWVLIWVRRECRKGRSRTTQDDSLEARGRH